MLRERRGRQRHGGIAIAERCSAERHFNRSPPIALRSPTALLSAPRAERVSSRGLMSQAVATASNSGSGRRCPFRGDFSAQLVLGEGGGEGGIALALLGPLLEVSARLRLSAVAPFLPRSDSLFAWPVPPRQRGCSGQSRGPTSPRGIRRLAPTSRRQRARANRVLHRARVRHWADRSEHLLGYKPVRVVLTRKAHSRHVKRHCNWPRLHDLGMARGPSLIFTHAIGSLRSGGKSGSGVLGS